MALQTSHELSGRRWQQCGVGGGDLKRIRTEAEADEVLQTYIDEGNLKYLERALNQHSHLASPRMSAMAANARDNLLRRDASAVEPRRKGRDHHSHECLLSRPGGGAPRYPQTPGTRRQFVSHYEGYSAPDEGLGEHPFAVDDPEGYNAYPHDTALYESNKDDRTRPGYSYALHFRANSPLQAFAVKGSPGIGVPRPSWNFSCNTESKAVLPRSARPSSSPMAPGTRSQDGYDPMHTHEGRDYENDHRFDWVDVEVDGGIKLGKSSIYRYGVHKQQGFYQFDRAVEDGISRRITPRLSRSSVSNFVRTGSTSANVWA